MRQVSKQTILRRFSELPGVNRYLRAQPIPEAALQNAEDTHFGAAAIFRGEPSGVIGPADDGLIESVH
jgi:hypothetical protein